MVYQGFLISIGIFQGDPLSVMLFNTVINLYVDFIHLNHAHLGYNFTGSQHCVLLLQYADDTCLVDNSMDNLLVHGKVGKNKD